MVGFQIPTVIGTWTIAVKAAQFCRKISQLIYTTQILLFVRMLPGPFFPDQDSLEMDAVADRRKNLRRRDRKSVFPLVTSSNFLSVEPSNSIAEETPEQVQLIFYWLFTGQLIHRLLEVYFNTF